MFLSLCDSLQLLYLKHAWLTSKIISFEIDSFHIVSAHASNSLVPRYLPRLHVKGQPVYGFLTLHNGIWKRIKRKIIPQIKIRHIVKLNDKCNKNK